MQQRFNLRVHVFCVSGGNELLPLAVFEEFVVIFLAFFNVVVTCPDLYYHFSLRTLSHVSDKLVEICLVHLHNLYQCMIDTELLKFNYP